MRFLRHALLLIACLAPACAALAAEIVIVTGAQSPIPELTREQAEQFYLGRSRSLPGGIVVSLADLPNGPLRDDFYRRLTDKNPSQIRAYWSRIVFTGRALPPQEADTVEQLRQWLAANPTMIGYLPRADADSRVKVVLRLP